MRARGQRAGKAKMSDKNEQKQPDDQAQDVPEGDVELTAADVAEPASDNEAARAEITELNDRILRLAAELENTRRRAEREKLDASRYAIASFARDLLNIVDTFERALASAPAEGEQPSPETVTALVAGLKMTDKELLKLLERHGVKRIAPKGEKFDPNLHQAVAQAPGDAPAGHVLDVAQPGFVIGERVLRAAMVVVSTGPGSAPNGEAGGPGSGDLDAEEGKGVHLDTRA